MGMLDMVQGGRYVSSPGRVKVAVYQSPGSSGAPALVGSVRVRVITSLR